MRRYPVPEGRLESALGDKLPPLTRTEALFEAARCLYCFDAPCIAGCPTSIDIPAFIRKISTDNCKGAARTILSANLLGASCARVCPVEVLCEARCVHVGDGRSAIAIGRLQRYATDHAGRAEILSKAEPSGRSVGLVGAGPASLACAGTLARLGHEAVIYEKRALPGGLNSTGVAPYKLRLEDSLAEVELITALGVEIRTGIEVGVQISAEELLKRHEAVFLGPGLGKDSRLQVPGEDGPGVIGAVRWIERLKTEPGLSLQGIRSAVVVGGGNTALDVSRELAGLGVPNVTLVYRRSRAEMSGYGHELSAARKEGVRLIENAALAEILRDVLSDDRGTVTGVRLVATEEGRPTGIDRGTLDADLVVIAIGQQRLRALAELFSGVTCDARGRIVADPETFVTGNPRVFSGGDARNGGLEVVNAVAEGQAAARSIDALIRAEVQHA